MTKRIDLNSEQDTIDLAYYIGPIIGPGAIISLFGELGSGKTFFVKALGAFLGISEDIDSPSFVLFKEYHCGRFPLYHLDLYRLKHEDELLDLGLLDMIDSGITVIEWPEIAQDFLPYQTLELRFGFDGEQRYVEVTAQEKLKKYFQ
ncbi:MAG: tRNA (adenosine(37)-N6)-threonylcarbamoyltransferase complex ATPase subunit type 1 TsaE [Candidatus Cloacimonadaceae bacterium]|jgi:tRNA threonylcarbamoyladenosine biosynthesis protein TsaE|nr:tRNA (adenosine(37)-N6)-threonylcarbamoyltransferase complex ATPase subunit type 1 TsaE [Candidatus Cloacimonadota bacterium]MDY0127261.1 tRNA (adenosine(37)-N6)-threonylcarbamoyltransferase complex ATPase subunit type 1 TsaE [Candidatus Cloacimonadaceae bacterium]MCB5255870.1 tRNA (adenosine(37)-N6)-threonylcarbamoyltransferase complex ATPase subunit type 1 TsaE [Candidatus Cloacimonadota bacterium]MCK9177797.1 tRNA (adenosine(37)-N6)-threonylcarbamoyltransferase complex ATPase subunit type 